MRSKSVSTTALISHHKTGRNLTAEQVSILADWLKTTP